MTDLKKLLTNLSDCYDVSLSRTKLVIELAFIVVLQKSFDRLDRSWHTALKKAKIIDFKFHDLRHTFASWLVMKGVDLASVQKLLGHKSIMMTMRYAHLSQGHTRKAVTVLDERCKIVAVNEEVKISKP